MRYALVFIAVVFTVYLFSAFVAADFDFTNWHPQGRFLAAVIAAIFGLAAVGATHE